MRPIGSIIAALALGSALGLAGCDIDVPDLNDPGLDQLRDNPTPSIVASACTGLLIGARAGTAAPNGYVSQLGILGRESYNFEPGEPRYISELLAGQLSPSSAFGGAFWAVPYRNMRLGDLAVSGAERVPEFDDAERAAIRGFVQTIRALDLLRVITTRDTIGAVITTELPLDQIAPIIPREQVLAEIARLLDEGSGQLAVGGEAFPFPLSAGLAGFDTPATFDTFNRALRARVAAYQEDYAKVLEVLPASFLDDAADSVAALEVGPAHSFSTGTGDTTNGLHVKNPTLYAHPSLETDVQRDGDEPDARFTRKVVTTDVVGSAQMLSSDLKFAIYADPEAPVPIIRNEELVLLRAEARWGTGDLAGAKADLDLVRSVSGGLPPMAAAPSEAELLDELVYNRRYSLLFEGGHRWIDARRLGRMDELPLDLADHALNVRYPLPTAECDGRVDEPACAITSQL